MAAVAKKSVFPSVSRKRWIFFLPWVMIRVHRVLRRSERIAHIQTKTTFIAPPAIGMALTSDVDHLAVPSGFFKLLRKRLKYE